MPQIKTERIVLSDGSLVYTRGPANAVQSIVMQPLDSSEAIVEVDREEIKVNQEQFTKLAEKHKNLKAKLDKKGKLVKGEDGNIELLEKNSKDGV